MSGPEVKKARTAFLYFQKDNLASIRQENNLSMGDAMTEVSYFCCLFFSLFGGLGLDVVVTVLEEMMIDDSMCVCECVCLWKLNGGSDILTLFW